MFEDNKKVIKEVFVWPICICVNKFPKGFPNRFMKGFMNIFPKEFPNKFPNRFTKIFDKTKTTQTLKTNKTGQHLRQGPLLGPTNAALHRS